jgi:hypothetical protein
MVPNVKYRNAYLVAMKRSPGNADAEFLAFNEG